MNSCDASRLARDTLLRALTDVMNDVAETIGDLPNQCRECKVYSALANFATKLRKAGMQEEASIVEAVREQYDI